MADPNDQAIVVGIDGSVTAGRALDWAVRQAELTAARLEVIITWEWPKGYGWAIPFPEDWDPQVDAQKALDEALRPARQAHPGVVIHTLVAEGHAAPLLVDTSRGAALLVVGSRGHGEFSGMLLGSVSQHCVTSAHCPVVVVRYDDEDERPEAVTPNQT
jgi:nucleotide-binding universal stress UspA family protein